MGDISDSCVLFLHDPCQLMVYVICIFEHCNLPPVYKDSGFDSRSSILITRTTNFSEATAHLSKGSHLQTCWCKEINRSAKGEQMQLDLFRVQEVRHAIENIVIVCVCVCEVPVPDIRIHRAGFRFWLQLCSTSRSSVQSTTRLSNINSMFITVDHGKVYSILIILRKHKMDLPIDCRTLLQTPPKSVERVGLVLGFSIDPGFNP